jgi:hypothetical protein
MDETRRMPETPEGVDAEQMTDGTAPARGAPDRYFLSSGQTLLDTGMNACSAGIVALSL